MNEETNVQEAQVEEPKSTTLKATGVENKVAEKANSPRQETVVIELTEDAEYDSDSKAYILRGETIDGEPRVYFINEAYWRTRPEKLEAQCVAGALISLRVENRLANSTTFEREGTLYFHSKDGVVFAGGLRKAGSFSLASAKRDKFMREVVDGEIDPAYAQAISNLFK